MDIKNRLIIKSNAKINLGLDILGKRGDGFHELRSIFQEVDWGDEVELEKIGEGIEFYCDVPELNNTENLCYRAAELMYENFSGGIRIILHKKIPTGSGLGGGSSNAAAVIKGINKLYDLGWSKEKMSELGGSLGSDVPFFIYGKTAHVSGRGEIINPIKLKCLPRNAVLVLPGLHLSTPGMYKKVKNYLTNPEKSLIITPSFAERLNCDNLLALANSFERIALRLYPELGVIEESLKEGGCEVAMMSGSGSAFFGLYDRKFRVLPGLLSYRIVKTTVVV
jgi:4-diphosphocytidyl-2-C-methyl-D-erythritol kinase